MSSEQGNDAGWSPEEWGALNDVAVKTVEQFAQLRRIIPQGPAAPNAYVVDWPKATAQNNRLGFEVTMSKQVTRISVTFEVKSDQLHDLPAISALVVSVAKRLARVEDAVLAYGKDAILEAAAGEARKGDNPGLLTSPTTGAHANAQQVLRDLNVCVKEVRKAYPGVLNAVLGYDALATYVQDLANDDADLERIHRTLGGRDSAVGEIPSNQPNDNVVAAFAPDPNAIDLVWTQSARLAHVATEDGGLVLRLEEAFLLRIKDPKAIHAAPKAEH